MIPALPHNEYWQQSFENQAQLLDTFKNSLQAINEELFKKFENDEAIVEELIQLRSDYMDLLLSKTWQHFFGHNNPGMALLAVGGYGRRELLPCSDIDLLILAEESSLETNQQLLESFITFLWDTSLDIGHSIRTIKECVEQASEDITIVTNLMESRTICGDKEPHQVLMPQITPENIWPSKEFFKAKWDEQISRHKKFGNTEYNLEPNIKSSLGGLRDIQMIGWIAKRHFAVNNIDELVDNHFLTAEEYEIMLNGQSFLLKIRFAMHMIAGREEDRLLFQHQKKIADMFGYKDTDANLGVELFMKHYFRWAGALSELNDLIMQLFDETILRACDAEEIMEINPRFRIRNNHIEAANDRVFSQNPSALLEIFVLMSQYENITGVRASTIRQVRENRHLIDDEFREDERNKQLFLDLIRSPRKVASHIKLMKRYGILGKFIPAFGDIIGQTQLDLFHIYTVDAHTIMVLKNARRFCYEDMREKYPIAASVMKRIEKKELLYLACLFHDIGKGRGGDHSTLGAEDAYQFCRSFGYNLRDSNMVSWLVKNHLRMSHISQKKDLSDPDVIRKFALNVGDETHLDLLFALTVADINGTNPNLWNSWRASLLRQLYYETKRALRRGLENIADKQDLIEERQQQARQKLSECNIDISLVELAWSNAGDDYFMRESANDIAWHTEAIAKNFDNDTALVLVKESSDIIFNNATQIFIHAKDRHHTFALVTAVLELHHMNIVDAKVYSSNSGYILDTFLVLDGNGEALQHDDERMLLIQQELKEKLDSSDFEQIRNNRRVPRQLKFFTIPTSARITQNIEKNFSVLEVIAADRPGLLATIGDTFFEFGVTLSNAKISTLGERVEDVFFITNSDGNAIDDEALCLRIEKTICKRLDEQVADNNE